MRRWSQAWSLVVGFVLVGAGCERGGPDSCEQAATKSECEAFGPEDCAWVAMQTVTDTDQCTTQTREECIPLHYQGAGCQGPGSCGLEMGLNTYFSDDDGHVRIFQAELCSFQPGSMFQQCNWSDGQTPAHAACDCVCN